MPEFELELYDAYGGMRLIAPVSLRDSTGSLGFVKALIDTGAPSTLIFETVLKRFRRLKPRGLSPPQYSTIGGISFERQTLGNLFIGLRDKNGNLCQFEQTISSGILTSEKGANPLEMIIGLDFLLRHRATLRLNGPKPVLAID